MPLDDSVHACRHRVMARAQALGDVTRACKDAGISRTLFYRWRRRPPRLSVQTERALLALALAWPTWGPARLAVLEAHSPRQRGS